MIDHDKRFAYFRIPKAANSTIVATLYNAQYGIKIKTLKEIQEIKDYAYDKLSNLTKKETKKLLDSYFKFTFVRDPLKRVVSCYLDKVKTKDCEKHHIVTKSLNKPFENNISMSEFLDYLESGGIKENGHWARQSDMIPLPLKELDFIGKTENLTNDLQFVLNKIFKKESPLISITDHSTNKKALLNQLTANEKERIYKLYIKDFKNFNY